ncbi:MAG: flagellar biosynthetic protein FliR [Planctomycetota bacterium]
MNDLAAEILDWTHRWELRPTGLTLLRIVPLVAVSPLFGGGLVPRRVLTMIAVVLALALRPPVPVGEAPALAAPLVVLAAKELLIGSVLAVLVRLAFDLLGAAGGFVDMARGAMIATIMDPSSQQQSVVIELFTRQILVVLFLLAGGHGLVLGALSGSFALQPVESLDMGGFLSRLAPGDLLAAVGRLFEVAVSAAVPVIGGLFLVDAVLALLAKAAPQIQAYFVGLAIKGSLGLTILFLALHDFVPRLLREALHAVRALIGA